MAPACRPARASGCPGPCSLQGGRVRFREMEFWFHSGRFRKEAWPHTVEGSRRVERILHVPYPATLLLLRVADCGGLVWLFHGFSDSLVFAISSRLSFGVETRL
ncbi:hypothetical protein BDZ45DRAFT_307248 [Acephala macrosclerotiorum]|nr:hypothetical protein BDZ45DRAFT_307248 [Acephala macrosclerotiorum]